MTPREIKEFAAQLATEFHRIVIEHIKNGVSDDVLAERAGLFMKAIDGLIESQVHECFNDLVIKEVRDRITDMILGLR